MHSCTETTNILLLSPQGPQVAYITRIKSLAKLPFTALPQMIYLQHQYGLNNPVWYVLCHLVILLPCMISTKAILTPALWKRMGPQPTHSFKFGGASLDSRFLVHWRSIGKRKRSGEMAREARQWERRIILDTSIGGSMQSQG